MTAGVPPRVEAGTKAALLDLVDGAVGEGWTTARACSVLELDNRRCRRWRHRRGAGRLDDSMRAAPRCMPSPQQSAGRSWSCSSAGATSTAATASSHTAAHTRTWSGCHRRRCIAFSQPRGWFCPPGRSAHSAPARPLPDWIEWRRHQIWIYDITHFPRAGRVAYAILDVVTRKWLATLAPRRPPPKSRSSSPTPSTPKACGPPSRPAKPTAPAEATTATKSRSCWPCQTTDPRCAPVPPESSSPSAP